jgi:hypothetical protein
MAAGAIEVQGLSELLRAFRGMSKDLDKKLTDTLKKAAEPAAAQAEDNALGNIRNMPHSPRWAGMRIGVGRRQGEVYMVPRARSGRRSSRPNLKTLLLVEMEAAVETKAADIEDALGNMVDDIADSHGF